MDFRRQSQLDLAAKLRANVSVLLAKGNETPEVVPLNSVKRTQLAGSTRVLVEVLSWTDVERYVHCTVTHDGKPAPNEERLADAVDKALERFVATV